MNTGYSSQRDTRQQKEGNCDPCKDKDNPTQKSITAERQKICDLLYTSRGNVSQLEKKFEGENGIYEEIKCLFRKTEVNYQQYRNLEITVGAELLQTNESVKANVAAFVKLGKDLNTALKNIAKGVKDIKTKFGDLKDASCKLESCTKDKCNISQWKAITGKAPDCKDEPPIEACKDAEAIFTELICRPKGLALDIDSIFASAYDVVGIQVFSNLDSLDPLQKALDDQAKAFEKQISATMKQRDTDLKKLQDDLVKSVQDITKAAMDRNTERSNFEGYYDATSFLCCPPCECLDCKEDDPDCKDKKEPKDNCEKYSQVSLKCCEKEICAICEDVKKAFCCDDAEPKNPPKQGC